MGNGGASRVVNEPFRELASAYFPSNSNAISQMAALASLSPDIFYAMRRGEVPKRNTILQAVKATGLSYPQTNQLLNAAGYKTLPDEFLKLAERLTIQQTNRIAHYKGQIQKAEGLEELPRSLREAAVAPFKLGLKEAERALSYVEQLTTAHSEFQTGEMPKATERRQPTRVQEEHLYAVSANGTEEQVRTQIGKMLGQGLSYGQITAHLKEQGINMGKALVRKRALRYFPELVRQRSSEVVLEPVIKMLMDKGSLSTADLATVEKDGRKRANLAIMLERWVTNHPNHNGYELSKETQDGTVYVARSLTPVQHQS